MDRTKASLDRILLTFEQFVAIVFLWLNGTVSWSSSKGSRGMVDS